MIDKVEFLRALEETDINGDIISDFTGFSPSPTPSLFMKNSNLNL